MNTELGAGGDPDSCFCVCHLGEYLAQAPVHMDMTLNLLIAEG